MKLAIDASNITLGGGLVHLSELLENADPIKFGITEVHVFSSKKTLICLPNRAWLVCHPENFCERGLILRSIWQFHLLPRKLKLLKLDMLLCPGGICLRHVTPTVAIIQNMQVFEVSERRREFPFAPWWRLRLLALLQSKTMQKCKGIIFLSNFSRNYIENNVKSVSDAQMSTVIYHGINQQRFFSALNWDVKEPIRILYVSTVKMYKHQWRLVNVVERLAKSGFEVELHLVGSGDRRAKQKMYKAIANTQLSTVIYHSHLKKDAVSNLYSGSHIFAFPSSCETFGISLLEAMSHGLPVACSNRGPMSEVLGPNGLYFDPEDEQQMYDSLLLLIREQGMRLNLSRMAVAEAQKFSWKKCSDQTFEFLMKVEKNGREY